MEKHLFFKSRTTPDWADLGLISHFLPFDLPGKKGREIVVEDLAINWGQPSDGIQYEIREVPDNTEGSRSDTTSELTP